MKNSKIHYFLTTSVCLISIFLSISSCKHNDVFPEETESATSIVIPEVQSKIDWIKSNGFAEKEVIYHNGTFFIDGDMMMSEQDVNARMQRGKPGSDKNAQRRWTYLVNEEKIKNVRVAIYSTAGNVEGVEDSWRLAFQRAMSRLNRVAGSTVQFVEVEFPGNAYDIIVLNKYKNIVTIPDNAVASGDLPTYDNKPGQRVIINTDYNNISFEAKMNVAIHELAHTIGITHTDEEHISDDGDTLDSQVVGTSNLGQDSESIMNFELDINNPITVLSANDRKAVTVLYPIPVHSASLSAHLIDDYEISFSLDFSGDYIYFWNFGDILEDPSYNETTRDSNSITHRFLCTTKSYFVQVLVRDRNDRHIVAKGDIIVKAEPLRRVRPLIFGFYEENKIFQFSSAGGEGCDDKEYYWDFGDGTREVTRIYETAVHEFPNTGTDRYYEVTLIVGDREQHRILSGPVKKTVFVQGSL